MKITFLGIIGPSIKYSVTLEGHNFSYSTGIGHAYIGKKLSSNDIPASNYLKELQLDRKIKTYNSMARAYIAFPSESDILECLQSDVEAGLMSFSDFCDTFGYSNDSIKAFETYRLCEDTAHKLRFYKFPQREEA